MEIFQDLRCTSQWLKVNMGAILGEVLRHGSLFVCLLISTFVSGRSRKFIGGGGNNIRGARPLAPSGAPL